MLKELDEIANLLRAKAEKLTAGLPEPDPGFFPLMTLEESVLEEDVVAALEGEIGQGLPLGFRHAILTYDFDGLELGALVIGDGAGFDRFLKSPARLACSSESRRLMIGETSGYAVLLDLNDGSVYEQSAGSIHQKRIATSFELFVRAAATVFLQERVIDNDAFSERILKCAGGDPSSRFWLSLVRGFA